jgi:hypothetical protein
MMSTTIGIRFLILAALRGISFAANPENEYHQHCFEEYLN